MAGSGIRGQFEEKFKALLRDIEDQAGSVICFIDEVRKCQYPARIEGPLTPFPQILYSTLERLKVR